MGKTENRREEGKKKSSDIYTMPLIVHLLHVYVDIFLDFDLTNRVICNTILHITCNRMFTYLIHDRRGVSYIRTEYICMSMDYIVGIVFFLFFFRNYSSSYNVLISIFAVILFCSFIILFIQPGSFYFFFLLSKDVR